MTLPARAWPPPPVGPLPRPPSRPGLRKCSEERAAKKLFIAERFKAWLTKNHTSVHTFACIADVAYPTAQAKVAGEHDVAIVDVLGLDDRHFDELLFAIREWRSAFRNGARAATDDSNDNHK